MADRARYTDRMSISTAFVLPAKPEDYVGEVRVPLVLENYVDWSNARAGLLSQDSVRGTEVTALVDTGASMLVLPEDVVDVLGLEILGSSIVEYADGRRGEIRNAGIVRVSVSGRVAEARCLVGPAGSEPLLGQLILEITDLLVDCSRQQLVPRPESPYMPSYKLK
jgi:clan AA aspartic protease